MTKELKKEIEELIILAMDKEKTRNGLPISVLVESIAIRVDEEFAKAVTEACELGPMLEMVGLEIKGKNS